MAFSISTWRDQVNGLFHDALVDYARKIPISKEAHNMSLAELRAMDPEKFEEDSLILSDLLDILEQAKDDYIVEMTNGESKSIDVINVINIWTNWAEFARLYLGKEVDSIMDAAKINMYLEWPVDVLDFAEEWRADWLYDLYYDYLNDREIEGE